jgi:hypothetical protein
VLFPYHDEERFRQHKLKAYERTTRPRGTKEYYGNKSPLRNIMDHKVLTRLEYSALYQSIRLFDAGNIVVWRSERLEEDLGK